ncbi:unnamed protein product [Discula destructiva]
MEAAADRIRSVVKNLLPERPHHLSLYPDRKYPVPPNFWQHQSPLQYSTFLSDADRGVLLTRPYFDICDELDPEAPTSRAPIRIGPKKTMNKMSFKDYKRQKEKASMSPTENGRPGKPDTHHRDPSVKLEKDGVRKELERPGANRDSKAQDLRVNGDSERSKNPGTKPAPRDAASPFDSKKRPSEADDGIRQHKKAKPSEGLSGKLLRPETPRSREPNSVQDRSSGREGRPGAPQSTPGSRPAPGGSRDRDRAGSPRTTVNGVKSSSSLSKKTEVAGKQSVPPLLSPLRHPAIDDELETTGPRKRPKESTTSSKTQTKPPKTEIIPKKQKATLPDLPFLLSPTLPAVVEDELERFDKISHKADFGQAVSRTPENTRSARKAQIQEVAEEGNGPKRFMVTFKIKKSQRPTVRRLLALPTKHKKERSASLEDIPPPAKKRPRAADSSIEAAPTIAAKRSRAADVPATKVPAPYTPPNPPAAISLPSSLPIQTPGDPAASTPNTAEAASTNRGVPSKETLSQRQKALTRLGVNLKRERDREKQARWGEKQRPNGASSNGERQTADEYRPAMMTMEMVLAFFIAFRSGDQLSEMSYKPADVASWTTLEAHLLELRRMTFQSLPLQTLATQLQGILVNEIVRAFSTHGSLLAIIALDDANAEASRDPLFLQKAFIRNSNNLHRVWSEVEKFRTKVTDERLKTPVMGPWTSPYKAAADTLVVMARIAEREHVNWRAEVVAPRE